MLSKNGVNCAVFKIYLLALYLILSNYSTAYISFYLAIFISVYFLIDLKVKTMSYFQHILQTIYLTYTTLSIGCFIFDLALIQSLFGIFEIGRTFFHSIHRRIFKKTLLIGHI